MSCRAVSHAHRRAVGFEHGIVAAEDGHARADDRLGQVHWGDRRVEAFALAGHGIEGQREGLVEHPHELPPRDGSGILRPWAADENDRGGESVGPDPQPGGCPVRFASAKCR